MLVRKESALVPHPVTAGSLEYRSAEETSQLFQGSPFSGAIALSMLWEWHGLEFLKTLYHSLEILGVCQRCIIHDQQYRFLEHKCYAVETNINLKKKYEALIQHLACDGRHMSAGNQSPLSPAW